MYRNNRKNSKYYGKLRDRSILNSVKVSKAFWKNKAKMPAAVLLSAVFCLFICIFLYIVISSMPRTTALKYIKCIKSKDYDKAFMYYMDVPCGVMINSGSIKKALSDNYSGVSSVTLNSIMPENPPAEYRVKFQLKGSGEIFDDSFLLYNSKSSLAGLKREWKILFPFKVRNITVTCADGCAVYIDGIFAGKVEGGILDINNIIYGRHNFYAEIPGMAQSEEKVFEINDGSQSVALKIYPTDEFRSKMEELIKGFCSGWTDYCLSRNPQSIKPYLTDKIYQEYINDTERFNGSRYEKCEYTISFKDISISCNDRIAFTVDEKWHTTEVITDSSMIFKDSRRAVLEQIQYICWCYGIINEAGKWKIDSADQISFKQDIVPKQQ